MVTCSCWYQSIGFNLRDVETGSIMSPPDSTAIGALVGVFACRTCIYALRTKLDIVE